MAQRYCTMPKIPFLRPWFERKFGDLCEWHDNQYDIIRCEDDRLLVDFEFAYQVSRRGSYWLAVFALIFFRLPWVKPEGLR